MLAAHQEDGFYANQITIVEHSGTHMDAPIHFVADGLVC